MFLGHSQIISNLKILNITSEILPYIPSASGVEVVGDSIFIVSDDSSQLFVLSSQGKPKFQVELFKVEGELDARISKKTKPDFEATSLITIESSQHLVIFGSGSRESRQRGFLVKMPNSPQEMQLPNFTVSEFSLKEVYDSLRQNSEIAKSQDLNIEGATTTKDFFVFLHRSNKGGPNCLVIYERAEFEKWLSNSKQLPPLAVVCTCHLPMLNNIEAGFSGASSFPNSNRILFTASVEDSLNAYEDGVVLGSFIGTLEIPSPLKIPDLQINTRSSKEVVFSNHREGDFNKVYKVESISILSMKEGGHYTAIAVTDNDQGQSTLLRIDFTEK